MTNEELKNIIARHVCNACEFGHGFDGKCDIGNDYRKCNICGEAAEALISAGIGDVKEAEHRAEVEEKARDETARQIYGKICALIVEASTDCEFIDEDGYDYLSAGLREIAAEYGVEAEK